MRPRARVLFVFVAACAFAFAADARADEAARARCTAAYEQAQELRRDQRLQAARAQLLICDESCPASLARDCATWLKEVDALIPTVRVTVRGHDGREVGDAQLSIDGRTVALKAGEAVPVEPGVHTFRFTRQGSADAEVRVEVYAGERDHPVDVTLPAAASPIVPLPVPLDRAPSRAAAEPSKAPSRVGSYVAGGLGSAALLVAGALAIKGHVDKGELESSCAPYCAEDAVGDIRTLWTVSAISAGVGALAMGIAVLLWPKAPDRHVKAARIVGPWQGAWRR